MADNADDGVRWLPFSLPTLRPQAHKRQSSKSSLESSSNNNTSLPPTPNMFAPSAPPLQQYNPSSSSSTPTSEDPAYLSFPRRTESPGERASSSGGPGGRTRAATFRRSVHENSKAVGWNERAPSPYGASLSPQRRAESPRSVPTRSPLATPPPPPPSQPPPIVPEQGLAALSPPPLAPLPRAPMGGAATGSVEMERPRAAPTPPKRLPLPGNNLSRTNSSSRDRAATGPSIPGGSGGGSSARASSPLRQILSMVHPPPPPTPQSQLDSTGSATAKQYTPRETNVQPTIRTLNSNITTSTSIPTSSTIPPLGPTYPHSTNSSARTSASPGLEASLSAAALHMQFRGIAARDSASTTSSGAASTMSLPNMNASSRVNSTVPSLASAEGPRGRVIGGSALSRTASLTSMRAAKMALLGGGGGSPFSPGGVSSRPGSIRSMRTGTTTTSRTSASSHHHRKPSNTSSLDSRLTRKLKGNHSSRYSMVSSLKVGLLEDQQAAEAARKKASATSPTSPTKNKRLSGGDHGIGKMTKSSPLAAAGKKKKKGETMSMLLEDGFFPLEEIVYGAKEGEKKGHGKEGDDAEKTRKAKARYSSMAGFKFSMPPRLSFVEGELSMMKGGSAGEGGDEDEEDEVRLGPPPMQTKESSRGGSKAKNNRRYGSVMGKTPLGQISEGDGRDVERKNSLERRISPGQLNAIPEGITTNTSSRRASTVTPVATQIKLRGGSVVTVNPPECNAWQTTIFIHGPIKLPKPTIMPRKNSVATLDPFQDAIDRVYQEALTTPRRRSDDAVVDDICDFFDEYGYDDVVFKEGEFWFGRGWFGEKPNSDRGEEMTPEDFLTPPVESVGATPVEMMLANGVVGKENAWPMDGKENEEMTRPRRGAARLSRVAAMDVLEAAAMRRKSSVAVVGHVSILQSLEQNAVSGGMLSNRFSLLPAVEASMLEPPLQPTISRVVSHSRSPQRAELSRTDSNQASLRRKPMSRADTPAGDSVKEMDAGSTWVGPGAAISPKEEETPSMSSKTGDSSIKRKGFSRMKKFVASLGTGEVADK